MIVVLKDISDYVFSSALKELKFSTNKDFASVVIKKDTEIILDEKYIPDSSGVITIYNLDELIVPYLSVNLCETFSYEITDSDQTKSLTFVVQKCIADICTTASDFLKNNFLTLHWFTKYTSPSFKEFLHLIPIEACTVKAECTYLTLSGDIDKKTIIIKSLESSRVVCTLDVSPSNYTEENKRLLSYIIIAGSRSLVFNVSKTNPDAAPILLFTNSFGCQETFYCLGTHSLEPEINRDAAYINGMFRTYHHDEDRIFKASTGILHPASSDYADDMLRSHEIYILDGDTVGKEITITESENKRNNDTSYLPNFTFSYRYAQKNQLIIMTPRAGRVFDNTFDHTFE